MGRASVARPPPELRGALERPVLVDGRGSIECLPDMQETTGNSNSWFCRWTSGPGSAAGPLWEGFGSWPPPPRSAPDATAALLRKEARACLGGAAHPGSDSTQRFVKRAPLG